MKLLLENENLKSTGSALALGFFDGVHIGHRAVIGAAVDYARAYKGQNLLEMTDKDSFWPGALYVQNELPEYRHCVE